MQKLLNKILAIIITAILIVIEFAPATVQAAEDVQNMQDSSTSQENVEFSASVNGKEKIEVDIQDEIELAFDVKVSNTGYLRDASIEISESNFTIDKEKIENVNEIDEDGKIILNDIRAEESVQAKVKANFTKNENAKASDFNKDSKITFNAVYVNGEGKEKKIEKEVKLNVSCTSEKAEETIYQELIRYIKFDNKTMISYRVNDEIKDSLVPIKNKEVRINVPQINKSNPTVTNIVGDYDEYVQEGNELVIKRNELKVKDEESEEDTKDKKKKEEKEDEYSWKSDDSYIVTFIYDTQENIEMLKGSASSKVTTILDKELKANTEIESEVKTDVGSLVELDLEGTDKLNKGYMYTNISRAEKINTEFNVAYKINVGMKDIVDKVVLKENDYAFNEFKTNVISTKVNTHVEELTKVLGEEGYVKVQDKEGNELGTLNKDTEEIVISASELTFTTSKPEAEGIITINVDKKIDDGIGYTREQIKTFNTLNTNAVLEGYMGENVLSTKQFVSTIALEEPKTSADVKMEPTTLSTVVENQDVEINVRLNTSDIEDALYTNPEIRIKLPDQVTGINITEGSLIYDSELKPAELRVEGNMIIAKLSGTQTRYNSDGIINGSIIKLLANVQMNNMATTANEKVIMAVQNEATGEIDEKTIDAEVVAPSDFIVTHSITTDVASETAFKEAKEIQIMQGTSEKVARISGTAINNLGRNADGFSIIGRIPAEGIQNFNGEDLNTNVTTALRTTINVRNIEKYKVYYSDNVNETYEGNWSLNPTATSKTFKIVAEEDVPHGKEVDFDYEITIPANVESGKDMTALYGVVYATNAVEGEKYNVVTAKTVGLFTEGDDTLAYDVEIYNRENPDRKINETTKPKAGEDVVYKVTVTNNGKTTLNNVNIVAEVNDKINFLDYITSAKGLNPAVEVNNELSSKTDVIESIAAGEAKTLYYNVRYGSSSTRDEFLAYKASKKLIDMDFTDEEKNAYVTYRNNLSNPPDTKTWEQLTNQIDQYSVQYDNLCGWLYTYYESKTSDEELNNFNTASMSIKATYGSRTSVMRKEDVIEKYTGAYMSLVTESEGKLSADEEIEVTAIVRAASKEPTGKLQLFVNIPNDMTLTQISSGKIDTNKQEYPLSNYYVRENGKINYKKIELSLIELQENKAVYLKEKGLVRVTLKLKANSINSERSNIISGYVTDTAYTVGDNNTVTYGDTTTVNSNNLNISIEKENSITATQTCSVGGDTIDTTPISFYINVKSESKTDKIVTVSDSIPDGLEVKEVYLYISNNGKTVKTGGKSVSQGISDTFTLPAGAEAILEIATRPSEMEKGSSEYYTSSPKVMCNTKDIPINEVSVTVKGTIEGPKDETVDPTNPDPKPTGEDPTKKYQLNGVVWKDENYNGIRDENDTRIKDINLSLYRKIIENGKIKDIKLVKQTSSNGLGEYSFSDVEVGEYYIIADYDSKELIITKYRVEKSNNMNNNDFTEQTLNGNKVATASIGVTNTDLYNIDLGLATRKNFKFKLEKFITKATITNSAYPTREYTFVNKHTAKIEMPTKNVENTTVIAEYTIKVTNIGKVKGTVENIADYLPKGMQFESELNSGWYLSNEGTLYNTSLDKKELELGETAEVKLILSKKMNGENLGLVHNISEIFALSSTSAQTPDDETPGNKKDGEDDISYADLIILMGTGRENATIVGITITILALISCATFIMKKYVMDKAI